MFLALSFALSPLFLLGSLSVSVILIGRKRGLDQRCSHWESAMEWDVAGGSRECLQAPSWAEWPAGIWPQAQWVPASAGSFGMQSGTLSDLPRPASAKAIGVR